MYPFDAATLIPSAIFAAIVTLLFAVGLKGRPLVSGFLSLTVVTALAATIQVHRHGFGPLIGALFLYVVTFYGPPILAVTLAVKGGLSWLSSRQAHR